MRIKIITIICSSGLSMLIASSPGLASDRTPLQGSKIIRIDDGTANGQCIQQTDKLTITLRGGTLEKKSRWLGLIQDTQLGLTMTTTVSGSTGDETKSASFAKVVNEPVSAYKTGQISLGQEQSLLSKFDLTNGQNTFTVVDLEVGIVRTQGQSVGAKILLGAVSATKSLSLPKNPFTSAYGIATTYVNSVFSPLLDQAAQDKEATSAHITMNINAAGCKNDDEFTGTKVIVFAAEDFSKPGYVDIANIDKYCWKAELRPTVAVQYAPTNKSGTCDQVQSYVDLLNSSLAFYVNALSSEAVKPNPAAVAALPKAPETTGSDRAAIAKDLSNLGVPSTFASAYAGALLSDVPAQDVGKAFGVKSRTVETYREAILRCKANNSSLSTCLK
jgi:hypothetical protein